MGQPVGAAPIPPLPYRTRPAQVLLGVGAVLLVSAGAAVASAYGGIAARLLLLVLAGLTSWFSLRAARMRLRSSTEVLAASAAGLAVVGTDLGGAMFGANPGTTGILAVAFFVLHQKAPTTITWPLASWGAAQLAVLHGLEEVPAALHTVLFLCVALAGLGIVLFARRSVARVALITSVPGGWPAWSADRRAPGRTPGSSSGSRPA
jgi:hypothetical protein